MIRLSASLAVGLLVAGMSLICAWQAIGPMAYRRTVFYHELPKLQLMQAELDERIATGRPLPRTLAELEQVRMRPQQFQTDQAGNVLDPWGRPYHYQPAEKSYELVSYGRDGTPGGTGLDEDLNCNESQMTEAKETLWQFVHDPPTNQMNWAYLISTVSAAGTTFVLTRNQPTTNSSTFGILVSLVVTAGSAVVAAFIMSLLHIPNYH